MRRKLGFAGSLLVLFVSVVPAAAQGRGNPNNLRPVMAVSLDPHGFQPRKASVPVGRFLLVVVNRTGNDALQLELFTAASGVRQQRLLEKRTVRGQMRWTQLMELPPGEYLLTDQRHPEWIFNLTIVNRGIEE
jgi:hypothetical protein